MKDYKLADYKNFAELRADMLKDLNDLLQDVEFTSDRFTDCEILEITKSVQFGDVQDFLVEISVRGGIKTFCIRPAVEQGIIVLPADINSVFVEMMNRLDAATKEFNDYLDAERKRMDEEFEKETALKEAKLARLKAKKEELEAQEKFEAKIKKAQEQFAYNVKCYVKIDQDPLDWLKENTTSITATVPSHLDKIFVEVFGDVPHKVVDSSRKTSGGYSMKFGPSFALTVKKDVPIPAELANLFKQNRLHDTKFISRLVLKHGFEFGKA